MSSTGRPPAIATVQADNERVRITEWRFPPGTTTGFHRHEFDYVVVPMITATLQIISGDSTSPNQITAGQAYFRIAGVEHEVYNENDFEVVFVETELK
jgi:quercetin dioxygenase-like cupin family protein